MTVAVTSVSVLSASAANQTGTLFAADGALSNSGNLYTVDTSTGLATSVGALVDAAGSQYSINGMAWDPSTQTLWGSTSRSSPTLGNGIVTINPNTAEVSPVGSLGLQPPSFAAGLDYTDGQLFGWAESSPSALITVDTGTGAGSFVGPNGQGINTTGSGIATNAEGTTFITPDFATGNLWQVDTATGQLVSPTPLSGGSELGRIGALEFLGGTLFGTELVGDGVSGITSNRLVSIDPTTGEITGIGQFRDAGSMDFLRNIDALAIPAPGGAFAIGLGGLAAVRRRR